MGWTYQHIKWRDKVRAQFKEETGLDYTDPSFEYWLIKNGYIKRNLISWLPRSCAGFPFYENQICLSILIFLDFREYVLLLGGSPGVG